MVGNKVGSERAVQFRKWANGIIEEFTIKGFAMARIVNAYLDLAELRAEEQVPMTMED